jgi:hypothetical protein
LRFSTAPQQRRGRPASLLIVLASAACVLGLPSIAQAENLFTVDSAADSPGPVVSDPSGAGYLAWERKGPTDTTMFCKIPAGGTCISPLTLALPASSSTDPVLEPFPLLGSAANVVYVVGARPSSADTLIWTSTDGGMSFSPPIVSAAGSDAGGTSIGDVLLDPAQAPVGGGPTGAYFDVSFANFALGFSLNANSGMSSAAALASPGGPIGGSTLAFAGSGAAALPVEAFWTSTVPYRVFFYRATSLATTASGQNWVGPTAVSEGYEPRLAGGPQGLFLLSTDIAAGPAAGTQPTVLGIRKYDPASDTFGPRTVLANLSSDASTLFASGDLFENQTTGDLYAVEPVVLGNGSYVMQLWTSADGGATFSGPIDIATIAAGFTGVPRLTVGDGGQGWLSFEDQNGLEIADLEPIVSAALRLPRSRRLRVKAGAVAVPVTCTSSATCRLALQLTYSMTTSKRVHLGHRIVVRTTTKVVTLGVKTFSVRTGRAEILRLHLNPAGRKLLAQRGKVSVQALLTSVLTGSSTQAELTIAAAKA